MKNSNQKRVTVVGTDIDEVKKRNAESGLSYNEVKQVLAQKLHSKSKE